MENHEYQSQEDYITCIVLGRVMNEFELFADQSTREDNTSVFFNLFFLFLFFFYKSLYKCTGHTIAV